MKNVSSKKKLKKCQFFSCNKTAVAQETSVTAQRQGGKTNTNEFLNSGTETLRALLLELKVFQQFSQNSNYITYNRAAQQNKNLSKAAHLYGDWK